MIDRMLTNRPIIVLVGSAVIAFSYGFLGASMALQENNFDVIARTPPPTEVSSYPPEQFSGGAQVAVRFVPPYMIVDECGLDALACFQRTHNRVVIINPCVISPSFGVISYRQRPPRAPLEIRMMGNEYTRQLCHELGHANGWHHEEGPIVSHYPGAERQQ